jgi:hypothetical protein
VTVNAVSVESMLPSRSAGHRSLATLGISARGSDAAQTPQLDEKMFSLYTEQFPSTTMARSGHDDGSGRMHG